MSYKVVVNAKIITLSEDEYKRFMSKDIDGETIKKCKETSKVIKR